MSSSESVLFDDSFENVKFTYEEKENDNKYISNRLANTKARQPGLSKCRKPKNNRSSKISQPVSGKNNKNKSLVRSKTKPVEITDLDMYFENSELELKFDTSKILQISNHNSVKISSNSRVEISESEKNNCEKLEINVTNKKVCDEVQILRSSQHNLNNHTTQNRNTTILNSQNICNLANWGLPLSILHKYVEKGVEKMFPWQAECLSNNNVLEHCANLIYSAPTSAGKTLVAEILALKTVFERKKKVLIILPFVSVVREKMFYFQDVLGTSGIRVDGFMGSYNPPGGFSAVQIAICTIEKANNIINKLLEENRVEELGAVVIDELHLLGDPNRGYLLELLLTKLRYMAVRNSEIKIQLIGMSATLPNLSLLAKWLNAELYKTDFRPIPLYEQCYADGSLYDNQFNEIRKVECHPDIPNDTDHVIQFCLETIYCSCSVLIFCTTKNWCESLAQQIATTFRKIGTSDSPLGECLREQIKTDLIVELLEQLKRCPAGLDSVLNASASFGIAFHHAGLTLDERDIIEGAFRSGALRVLIATSTLSSGVNLPARRVIIRSPLFGGRPIDTLNYRQMIGRAGRMGKDTAGESILICQKTDQRIAKTLLSAELRPISSCLEGSGKLKRAILEVIASGVASSPDDVTLFTECTLLAYDDYEGLENPIENAIEFLRKNEFIRLQKTADGQTQYVASLLAKACLSSSLPPEEGLNLFEEIDKARQCFVLETELHMIYLVTPYSACNQWANIDWMFFYNIWQNLSKSDRRVADLVGVTEGFLVKAIRGKTKNDNSFHTLQIHRRFYTALALQELVQEVPLNTVASKFNCNRGVLQSLQLSASTFAGMVTAFSRQLGWSSIELLVGQFQDRLQFGVNRELLDLMRLSSLNGIRARALYNAGIESIVTLAAIDVCVLENALHSAGPFQSEKERDGETTREIERRKNIKTVWITGKKGLTEREAAELLIVEARNYLKCEIGLTDAKWTQNEYLVVKQKSEANYECSHCTQSKDTSKISNTAPDATSQPQYVELTSLNGTNISKMNITEHQTRSIVTRIKRTQSISNKIDANKSEKSELSIINKDTGSIKIGDRSGSSISAIKITEIDKINSDSLPKLTVVLSRIASSNNDTNLIVNQSNGEFLSPKRTNLIDSVIELPIINIDVNSKATPQGKDTQSLLKRPHPVDSIKLGHSPPKITNVQFSPLVESYAWSSCTDLDINLTKDVNISKKSLLNSNRISNTFLDHTNGSGSLFEDSLMLDTNICEILDDPVQYVPKINNTSRSCHLNSEEMISTPIDERDRNPVVAISLLEQAFVTNFDLEVETSQTETNINVKNSITEDSDIVENSEDSVNESPFSGRSHLSIRNRTVKKFKSLRASPFSRTLKLDKPKPHSINRKKCISPTRKSINNLSNARDPINLSSIDIIEVCGEKKLYQTVIKELMKQRTISLSIGYEKYVKKRCSIGPKSRNTRNNPNRTVLYNHDDYQMDGFAICCGSNSVYYFRITESTHNLPVQPNDAIEFLKNMLHRSDLTVKQFDCKEQIKVLHRCCNIPIGAQFSDPKMFDWLIHSEEKEKNLQAMALKYAPEVVELTHLVGSGKGVGSLGLNIDNNQSARLRASIEAVVTWFIVESQQEALIEVNPVLKETFNLEMKSLLCLARMELFGLGISKERMQNLIEEFQSKMRSIEKQAHGLAGRNFSLASPIDITKVLKLKGRKAKTTKEVLEALDNPIANLILLWRKLNTSLTRMLRPIVRSIELSRIHGCCDYFNATGRISMYEPNLQTIPKDFDIALDEVVTNISVRSAFVAGQNNTILTADFCQLELRLLAHLSQDDRLCAVMRSQGDVFQSIAAEWNKIPITEVNDKLRNRAKQLCYGIIYGMGSKTLAGQMNLDEQEASLVIKTFKNTYPSIQSFIDRTIADCRRLGYVETLNGRRRYLPAINHSSSIIKSHAERQAVNTTIQGSAADMAKSAMVLIDDELKSQFTNTKHANLVLQLHDELLYEVDSSKLDEVGKLVKRCMEEAVKLSIPFPVKLKCGKSWGELNEIIF